MREANTVNKLLTSFAWRCPYKTFNMISWLKDYICFGFSASEKIYDNQRAISADFLYILSAYYVQWSWKYY